LGGAKSTKAPRGDGTAPQMANLGRLSPDYRGGCPLRCPHSLPQMRSGRNVGLALVDGWWGRLSRIFRTGLCLGIP